VLCGAVIYVDMDVDVHDNGDNDDDGVEDESDKVTKEKERT